MIEHAPSTVEECSAVLGGSSERIAFVGGGTELDLGPQPVVDAVVRTERLTRIPDYAPADMVITAEAGVTLARLQAAAREHGQMLALDPPLPERATIGGLVATGAYGPRRARYGAIRDLIIGVTMVRADGVVARGGGKVVKNVAGFDLPKVACGSLGTLGMIANATFRLHPLPEAETTVRFDALTPEQVFALVLKAREAQMEPSSVVAILECGGHAAALAFRFEGFAKGVEQQTTRMLSLGGERDDGSFWQRHDAIRTGGKLRLRIAAMPSQFADVARAIAPLPFAWYATLGLGFVSADVDVDVDIAKLRRSFSVIVEKAPVEIDVWGPKPNFFPIMEQLKLRFDPRRRLNPGRFVGGL
jgi:glycolate oxidase FAD binding subunit